MCTASRPVVLLTSYSKCPARVSGGSKGKVILVGRQAIFLFADSSKIVVAPSGSHLELAVVGFPLGFCSTNWLG